MDELDIIKPFLEHGLLGAIAIYFLLENRKERKINEGLRDKIDALNEKRIEEGKVTTHALMVVAEAQQDQNAILRERRGERRE